MKYVKNLVKILLLAQCLLLFCTCNKKEAVPTEIETTEQNELNLADFVKCPFKDVFDGKTNLEKYVLKKFGRPKYMRKWRAVIYDNSEVVADQIQIAYEDYSFEIYRGVSKRFEVFNSIYNIPDGIDLKYGIKKKETTIKDIERLFGKPEEVYIDQDSTSYSYIYSINQYDYKLYIRFKKGEVAGINIDVRINM